MKSLILTLAIILGTTAFAGVAFAAGAETATATTTEAKTEISGVVAEDKVPLKAAPSVAENQIPLTSPDAAVKAVEPSSSGKLLLGVGLLLGFALIGFMAIKKYRYKDVKGQQFQMKVLSQFHLSPRKSLAVVQVAGESILLGVTDHHISMIKSLSLLDEDLENASEENMPKSFDSVFSSKPAKEMEIETETYSMARIQDVVSSKIKSMRSL